LIGLSKQFVQHEVHLRRSLIRPCPVGERTLQEETVSLSVASNDRDSSNQLI
jgi:hypothetical protein